VEVHSVFWLDSRKGRDQNTITVVKSSGGWASTLTQMKNTKKINLQNLADLG
jgi:hypothetical protein